jgi:Protein of unknown function (DUF3443)
MIARSRSGRRRGAVPVVAVLQALIVAAGCGGSSSSSTTGSPGSTPVANTVTVTIDGGPVADENIFNALYTSVRICVPGSTTECQTIAGVLVDTGSSGLRILSSAILRGVLTGTPPAAVPWALPGFLASARLQELRPQTRVGEPMIESIEGPVAAGGLSRRGKALGVP